MLILMDRIRFQRWYTLFLQGESQLKLRCPEMYEFYTNSGAMENLFTISVCGVSMYLFVGDIALNLYLPLDGWDNYVKYDWYPLDNMTSALAIYSKFLGNANLVQHRRVLKR